MEGLSFSTLGNIWNVYRVYPRVRPAAVFMSNPPQENSAIKAQMETGPQPAPALARLAAIVESSDDAIVSKTLDGIITTWNAGAQRIFGWSAQEAVGKAINIIIPPDRQDEEPQILQQIRAGQ